MYQESKNAIRPRLHLMGSALLVCAALLAGGTVPAHAAGERAEAPQVKVGDRWKSEQKDKRSGVKEAETTRTVTAVSAGVVEGTENDGTFKMTADLNPIESPNVVVTGEPKFLNFPLEVGKKWSFKYNFANKTNQNKGRIQLDAEVMAFEKITVPAGSFDTFRVESKGFWNNDARGSSGRSKTVYWYAPAARAVIRTEYEDGFSYWVRDVVEMQLQP